MRIPTLVAAAAALEVALAGSPGPSGAAPVQEIVIHTFQFQPSRLEVTAGSTVRWTNDDDIEHIVTSGTPEQRSGMFRTSLNGKGTAMNFTLAKAGNYSYFCDRHQSMRGEIVVK